MLIEFEIVCVNFMMKILVCCCFSEDFEKRSCWGGFELLNRGVWRWKWRRILKNKIKIKEIIYFERVFGGK